MNMRYILALTVVLVTIFSCSAESTKRPIKRIGPHRPIKPTGPTKPTCTKKPIVVAVIDTGFGALDLEAKLCKTGHKDFTNGKTSDKFGTEDEVPIDAHGHGTHIAGIIDSFGNAADVNYCLVILKYYDYKIRDSEVKLLEAIKYATDIRADYINYSGGGISYSKKEKMAVKAYLDGGGKFISAAGNERSNIDKHPFYPAMDDPRVIVVGAVDANREKIPASNYGKNVKMELGKDIQVCDYKKCIIMSGTSQATAIFTGKLLAKEKNSCN